MHDTFSKFKCMPNNWNEFLHCNVLLKKTYPIVTCTLLSKATELTFKNLKIKK